MRQPAICVYAYACFPLGKRSTRNSTEECFRLVGWKPPPGGRAGARAAVTGSERKQFFKIFLLTALPPLVLCGMALITQNELKRRLRIDPNTGECRWPDGRLAGSLSQKGYLRITLNKREYRAHRLVWLWVHGAHPPEDMTLDHINGIKTDNRISNLRLATVCQNIGYRSPPSDRRNILRDPKGFRVEMVVANKRYRRRAATLEKALAVREAMYAEFGILAQR